MATYTFDVHKVGERDRNDISQDCSSRSDVEMHVRRIVAEFVRRHDGRAPPVQVTVVDKQNAVVMTATATDTEKVKFVWI